MGKHRKAKEVDTVEMCKHGCGNKARYLNLSGDLICSMHIQQCPTIKALNSQGLKKVHSARPGWFYDFASLPKESRDRMAHTRGKTLADYEPLKRQVENRHQNYLDGKWELKLTGVALDPKKRWKRNKFDYYDSFGDLCTLESWNEFILANELDRNDVKWLRPKAFTLSDGKRYEPDFYLTDFDVYLDPKSKFFGKNEYLGYKPNESQIEKIERFEKEYNVSVLVLWAHEKKSLTWESIKARMAKLVETQRS